MHRGKAASAYFSVLDDLILQQRESIFFHERNRRPPTDRMNAPLSFVYTLLAHDTASALETAGLNPYAGFLHRDRPGHLSLALDLMKKFYFVLADRFVLTLVNTHRINREEFVQKEKWICVYGGCYPAEYSGSLAEKEAGSD